jgi:hypothetical protein
MKTRGGSILFALLFAALMTTGCDNANKKLAVLDGKTFAGDAPPKMIMGVQMYGHYQLSFSQKDDDQVKCVLTSTIHDGQNGWGLPESKELQLIFKDDVDGYGAKTVWVCNDPTICTKGAPREALISGQVPDSFTYFNEQSDEITLHRSK